MNHEHAQTKLTERRKQLLSQIGKIESHLASPLEADSEERSVQLENDEVLEALDEAGRTELQHIDAALGRLAAGTYGACATCHRDISPARLDAVPYAELCIDCAD